MTERRWYTYQALNASNKVVTGSIDAESATAAKKNLKTKGLIVFSIDKQPKRPAVPAWSLRFFWKTRINQDLFVSLMTQIASLLHSGAPLLETLQALSGDNRDTKQKELLNQWATEIQNGNSFSNALRTTADRLPEAVGLIAAVEAGEQSGLLSEAIVKYASNKAQQVSTQKQIKQAMIYPSLVLVTSFLAIAYLLIDVIPKLTSIFIRRDIELPWSTEIVLSLSAWLGAYWQVTATLTLLLILIGSRMSRHPPIKQTIDSWLVRTPLIGRWIISNQMVLWCGTLGSLLESQVPMPQAIKIANSNLTNAHFKSLTDAILARIIGGFSLTNAISQSDNFPDLAKQLVQAGERSNTLSQALGAISDHFSQAIRSQTKTFVELLNPLLLLFVAGAIMFIMMSVLTPILEMNRML